jgi:hypothetical protein
MVDLATHIDWCSEQHHTSDNYIQILFFSSYVLQTTHTVLLVYVFLWDVFFWENTILLVTLQCCHHHAGVALHIEPNFHPIFLPYITRNLRNMALRIMLNKEIWHCGPCWTISFTIYWFFSSLLGTSAGGNLFFQHHPYVDYNESHTQTSISLLHCLLPCGLSCMISWDCHIMCSVTAWHNTHTHTAAVLANDLALL